MIKFGSGWRRRRVLDSRILLWAVVSIALAAVFGCAATGGGITANMSPEARAAAVTERVNGRWAALIKGDRDAAYLFLSPASREAVTLAQFKSKTRETGFREARIENVECEPEVCKVRLFLSFEHRQIKGLGTPLEERWVISQGQAWYVWQQ